MSTRSRTENNKVKEKSVSESPWLPVISGVIVALLVQSIVGIPAAFVQPLASPVEGTGETETSRDDAFTVLGDDAGVSMSEPGSGTVLESPFDLVASVQGNITEVRFFICSEGDRAEDEGVAECDSGEDPVDLSDPDGTHQITGITGDLEDDVSYEWDADIYYLEGVKFQAEAVDEDDIEYESNTVDGIKIDNVDDISDPSGLTAEHTSGTGGEELRLEWHWDEDTEYLEHWDIERIEDGDNSEGEATFTTEQGPDSQGTVSIIDDGEVEDGDDEILYNNQTYCYRIRGNYKAGFSSSWSSTACGSPNAAPKVEDAFVVPDPLNMSSLPEGHVNADPEFWEKHDDKSPGPGIFGVGCVNETDHHETDLVKDIEANFTLDVTALDGGETIETGLISCTAETGNFPGDGGGDSCQGYDWECVMHIHEERDVQLGDKYDLYVTAYDQIEYSNTLAADTAVVKNTRPWASNVKVEPEDPVNDTDLECTYEFNDMSGNPEDKSETMFKWEKYDGDGGWDLIKEGPGKDDNGTLNVGNHGLEGEEVRCGVKVKDEDLNWDGFKDSLYDSQFRYSDGNEMHFPYFTNLTFKWNSEDPNPTMHDLHEHGGSGIYGVGFANHTNPEEVDLYANYTLTETVYPSGQEIYSDEEVECVGAGDQWINQSDGNATFECLVSIDEVADVQKGNKYDLKMTVYDANDVYSKTRKSEPEQIYINNTRPWAEDVKVLPEEANESSTLECNYTFEDLSGNEENITEAEFRWYRNRDGANQWNELEGQTDRTLENTDQQQWFSDGDEVKCSVSVKDIDQTWEGKRSPLRSDGYFNSTARTVKDNAPPSIGDHWNDAPEDDRVGIGEEVNISAEWLDPDDDQVRLAVCEDGFLSEVEDQFDGGDDSMTFGGDNKAWFYTDELGALVESIGIRVDNIDGGSSTDHIYDLYAYEVHGDGYPTNITDDPISSVNDISFREGEIKWLNFHSPAWVAPGNRIAMKLCVDDGNTGNCDPGGPEVSISATEGVGGDGDFRAKEFNMSDDTTEDYHNPDIVINYESSARSCQGELLCNTSLSSENPISCSYNTKYLTEGRYDYEARVFDPHGQGSEVVNNSFWVENRPPEARNVSIVPEEPLDNSTLTCNYTFYDPDYGQEENTSETEIRWYKNQDGMNEWLPLVNGSAEDKQNISNKEDQEYFSPHDQIKCSVKAVNEEGVASEEHTESEPVVIDGNYPPTITNYTADATFQSPAQQGDMVNFSLTWLDEYSEEFEVAICEEIHGSEDQYDGGDDYLVFGGEPAWFYTQETGKWAETISIFVDEFKEDGQTKGHGNSTSFKYDIYVYSLNETNTTSDDPQDLVTKEQDVAFTAGQYTDIRLGNAEAMTGDVLAFKFCIDSNNDGTCDGGLGEDLVRIPANGTDGNHIARNATTDDTVDNVWDPAIEINYRTDMEMGCYGEVYCYEEVTAEGSHGEYECSYNTTDILNWENSYEVRVSDDDGAKSRIFSDNFYVNVGPRIENLSLSRYTPRENESITCNFDIEHDNPNIDIDDNVTTGTYWYYRGEEEEDWNRYSTQTSHINQSLLDVGDRWKCSVNATDDYGLSEAENTSVAIVRPKETEHEEPYIEEIMTTADDPDQPVTVGEELYFEVYWEMAGMSEEEVNLFICNSTDIGAGGCGDEMLVNEQGILDEYLVLEYETENWNDPEQDYHAEICNEDGDCSETESGTFYVNRAPWAENISLVGHEGGNETVASIDEAINCTYDFYDPDGSTEADGHRFRWYRYQDGDWSPYTESYDPRLGPSRTSYGDLWKCSVSVSDGHTFGEYNDSQPIPIGTEDFGIEEVFTNAIIEEPVNYGENISVGVTWADPWDEVDEVRMFVCSEEDASDTGCTVGKELCRVFDWTDTDTPGCEFNSTVFDEGEEVEDYHLFLYGIDLDDGTQKMNKTEGEFYINQRPMATDVNVTPDPASEHDTLECEYDFHANYSQIGTVNESKEDTVFRWYVNDELVEEGNHRTLDEGFSIYDNVSCAARVVDQFGLSDSEFRYSDEVMVEPVPTVPTIWPLPEAIGDELLHVVGYMEYSEDVDSVTVQALNEDNQPKTNDTDVFEQTALTGEGVIVEDAEEGSSHIKINDTENVTGFEVSDYIEIEGYEHEYFEYYNITNITELKIGEEGIDVLRLGLEENLTEGVTTGTGVRSYDNNYPDGWFNLSTDIWAGLNEVLIWGSNQHGDGGVHYTEIYKIPYPPSIIHSIPGGSESGMVDFEFNVEHDYPVSEENVTFEMNESKSESAVQYQPQCESNVTSLECLVTVDLEDGEVYNITIYAEDVVGNVGTEEIKNFVVSDYVPNAPEAERIRKEVDISRLPFSWNITVVEGEIDVSDIQYAVGESRYDEEGWKSIANWTYVDPQNVSLEGNYTTDYLDLEEEEKYHVSVRYRKYRWSKWSRIDSTGTIKYTPLEDPAQGPEDVEIIYAPDWIDTEPLLEVNWTESEMPSEYYDMERYEYTVGTAPYNESGWKNLTGEWVSTGLETNISEEFEFEDREDYYFNVRAVAEGGFKSNVTSTDKITYYNQTDLEVEVTGVGNDTDDTPFWLDDTGPESKTNITIQGSHEMSCYYSPYDRGYPEMEEYEEGGKCDAAGDWEENLTCQIDLEEGEYTKYIACRDAYGSQSRFNNTEVNFYVDHSPPEIDILYPQELDYDEGKGRFGPEDKFLVNMEDEPGGIDRQNFTIYNQTDHRVEEDSFVRISPEGYSMNYTYSWDTTEMPTGEYRLVVEAEDKFNNTNSTIRKFELNKIPPNITTDVHENVSDEYFQDSFNLTTEIRDFQTASYNMKNDEVLQENTTKYDGSYNYSYNWTKEMNITDLEDDRYEVLYYANDTVGNDIVESLHFYVNRHAWFNSSNPIDNQSWTENNVHEDAIDLGDHFVNTVNVSAEFRHSDPDNITVLMDEGEYMELSGWHSKGSGTIYEGEDPWFVVDAEELGDYTLSQNVSVEGHRDYVFESFHKANNTDSSKFEYSVTLTEYNSTEETNRFSKDLEGTETWERVSFNYTTREDVDKLGITLEQNPLEENVTTNSSWKNTSLFKYYEGPVVSFMPDDHWKGTNEVVFYASDRFGVEEPSNTVVLNVTDDYCNPDPDDSGVWVIDQEETAMCGPADGDLIDEKDVEEIQIVGDSTVNMTNIEVNVPVTFEDDSQGNIQGSKFTDTVYLKDSSFVWARDTSFSDVEIEDNAGFDIDNSPDTIEGELVIDNDPDGNPVIVRETVVTSIKLISGKVEINSSDVLEHFKVLVDSKDGGIVELTESDRSEKQRVDGNISTENKDLVIDSSYIPETEIVGESDSDFVIKESNFTTLDSNSYSNVTLEDSEVEVLALTTGSRISSRGSKVGSLRPKTATVESPEPFIEGSLTIDDVQDFDRRVNRSYPVHVLNHEGQPPDEKSVRFDYEGRTLEKSDIDPAYVNVSFGSPEDLTELEIEQLNFKNLTIGDDTPITIKDRILDPDGDGVSILNDDHNDGVSPPDELATVIGNATWVDGNLSRPGIDVDGVSIDSMTEEQRSAEGAVPIDLYEDGETLVEFDWNLSTEHPFQVINVDNGSHNYGNRITVYEGKWTDGEGDEWDWLNASGIGLDESGTGDKEKTVYLREHDIDDFNGEEPHICIRDGQVEDVYSTIDGGCTAEGEVFMECTEEGNEKDGYTCEIVGKDSGSGHKYKVTGLTGPETLVVEMPAKPLTVELQSPGDGSSGIGTSPELSVSVHHEDGDDIQVGFFDSTTNNLIGEDLVYDGQGYASTVWDGLEYGTEYKWYVVAEYDGKEYISQNWTFTTEYEGKIRKPEDGSTDVSLEPDLSIEFPDPYGWTEGTFDVTFYSSTGDKIDLRENIEPGEKAEVEWEEADQYETEYSWYVVIDNGTDTRQLETWSFITEEEEDDDDTGTSPGGGGGGAGGFAPSSDDDYEIYIDNGFMSVREIYLDEGDKIDAEIDDWDGGIYRFVLEASEDIEDGEANFTLLENLPVSEPRQSGYEINTYQDFSVGTDLSGKIEEVGLYFEVSAGWKYENDIDEVEIWRHDQEWNSLSTRRFEGTQDKFRYRGRLPGFSYISVVGKLREEEDVEPEPRDSVVEGTVLSYETDEPIGGILVTVEDKNTGEIWTEETDSYGGYSFEVPSGTTVEISTSHTDFMRESETVETRPGTVHTKDFVLEKEIPEEKEYPVFILLLVILLVAVALAGGAYHFKSGSGKSVEGGRYNYYSKQKPKTSGKGPKGPVETSTGKILSSPERFKGKRVRLKGDVEPYKKYNGKTFYQIKDGSGALHGISSKPDYKGRGKIEGKVRVSNGKPYLYF